jgi:hypothetical protein
VSGFWCEFAWVEGGPRAGVRVLVDGARITGVRDGAAEPGDLRLPGLRGPGSPTRTGTRSTAPCAGAPTTAAAPSGRSPTSQPPPLGACDFR